MAAAASPMAAAAYNGPAGAMPIASVGTATYHFLNLPIRFSVIEFAGITFIIFVLARHWGKFVNSVVA